MRMIRSEALLEYLSLQLKIPGMSRFGGVARAFDALATAAPAVREIITIGKVLWEVREERWDIVVADAPPTGQIGSYLRAPTSIAELVPTGRIRRQSAWMGDALSDPEVTALLLVSLAEELPATETQETIDWLEREQVAPPPSIIVNRVLPSLDSPDSADGMAGDMLDLHRSLWSEQQTWIEALPADLQVPFLFGLFTPGEVAARMSDELDSLS